MASAGVSTPAALRPVSHSTNTEIAARAGKPRRLRGRPANHPTECRRRGHMGLGMQRAETAPSFLAIRLLVIGCRRSRIGITSASPSFWQVMPRAHGADRIRARWLLCVLMCGRLATRLGRRQHGIRAMCARRGPCRCRRRACVFAGNFCGQGVVIARWLQVVHPRYIATRSGTNPCRGEKEEWIACRKRSSQ